jgi:hypothetical protein
MDTPSKKIFTFSDPRQERIHKKLLEIGPVPAGFFKDACEMWEEEPPKESKTNLIAHCMREVMGTVIDLLLPVDFAVTPEGEKKQESHKEKVKAILEAYDIDPTSEIAGLWLRTANKQDDIAIYHFVHRNNLGFPTSRSNSFKDLWESVQIILDAVLNKMEGKYVGFFEILDQLVVLKTVTDADVKKLKDKVPNSPVTYNHFFGKLDNSDWLTPLSKAGFFKNPSPAMVHPEGGTSYPFWPQGIYLKKMAAITNKQEEVLKICLAVETNNTRARSDLLEIALLLPVEMSVQIVGSIDEIDYFLSPEKYGKLIKYFSANGKIKEAQALAERVLIIQPDPRPTPEYGGHKIPHDPVPLIRDYDYEDILEKDYPEFVDAAGMDAIKVLLDQIEKYIKISDEERESGSKDDLSEIWRSSIEESSQSHKYGIRDVLISGTRDAFERLLTKSPAQIGAVIDELESRDFLIFKRLELHLLRLFPKGSEEKITQLLMDNGEFGERQRLTHEYFLLGETHGSLLSAAQKKELWSWIEKGGEVDMEEYKATCKERGIEPSDESVAKYKKNWQLYHLVPFKNIDPTWRKYYDELVAAVGEPEFPSFRSWSGGGSSWGFKSGITDEQFKEKTPEEIIDVLKDWEPEEQDNPLGTSREGTSRALTAQITEDPSRWSKSLVSFSGFDPTYARSVFSGHRDALRQNKTFDWKPLLDLCLTILAKPIEVKERKPSGFFGDDPDWNWSRNTIAELLLEGLQNRTGNIPQQFRSDVWKLIEVLTHDADPTPEHEAEQLESTRDPLTIAISSTRGDALQAAIQYGVWIKDAIPEEKRGGWSLEKNVPELLRVLEDHLDIKIDPSIGIRAVYGEKLGSLAWLDEAWVEKNAKKIFPDEAGEQKYFDAAWETFITYNGAYYGFLHMLKPQYQRAIKEIGKHTDGRHHLENPEQNLAQHLVLFYTGEKIPLETGLLKDFYDVAPLELRAEVIDFIGRGTKEKKMTEVIKSRLVALAEKRITEIKAGANPRTGIQEFKDFSWWIYSGEFDDKWSLDILNQALSLGCDIEGDHLIVEQYKSLAPKYPLEVITSTELMVENDKKGWGVPSWGEELRNVIQQILDSKNEAAITKAKEFIHRLVAKGHPQFMDLLPKEKKG